MISFSDLLVIKSHSDRREQALQHIPSKVKDNTNGNFPPMKKESHNHFQKAGKKIKIHPFFSNKSNEEVLDEYGNGSELIPVNSNPQL